MLHGIQCRLIAASLKAGFEQRQMPLRLSLLCSSFETPRLFTPPIRLFPTCRANAQQPKLFVGMILILIFAEALALYGLIGGSSISCFRAQTA